MASADVSLYEVALTDGLLASGAQPSAELRNQIIQQLADCGLSYVEVGALQALDGVAMDRDTFDCACRLAESAEVTFVGLMRDFAAYPLVRRTALDTISIRLLACEQAIAKIGADWGVSSVALALDTMETWLPAVLADGYRVRISIYDVFQSIPSSSAALDELVRCARGLVDMGCFQISFADTCGSSSPREVRRVARVLIESLGCERVAMQLGNALGRGLANFQAALKAGVQHFDTTLAGIGCGGEHGSGIAQCLATEDVVAFCQAEGIATGVDLPRLVRTARYAGAKLGLATQSLYARFCDSDGLPLHPSRWRCQL